MPELSGIFTSKGQLVVPAQLRRKHGIEAGTRVNSLTLFAEGFFCRYVNNALASKTLLKQALGGRADILMSAINFSEVYGIILRDHGKERALAVISALQSLPIRLSDITPQRAFHAAEIKSKYRLHYVDSFAAALAIENKATLVTSDSDFRRMGHSFPTLWLKA
jgi:predicted nucleic acid-binding protein